MNQYADQIPIKLQEWMIDSQADFGYFYMNYKAHKPEKGYPGRMITSGCGSPTERLSTWCEYHLKPLMKKLPYRLEDTSHFIRKVIQYNEKRLEEDNPDPIIVCSWDIEAMYPNITNDLGLTACRELLDRRDSLVPTTDCIVDAIRITLEENIARFGEKVVKQCDGTAMGPHHACSYADAAADLAIDQKVMDGNFNPFFHLVDDWSRFRDDIMCMWKGSVEELQEFHTWINNLHPRLKFTMEYSTSSIVFLDLRVSTGGPMVLTQMYSKSSDTHAYLMPESCHPTHVCRNIPKGVMKRVKRNCTEESTCEEGFLEYKQHLLNRGYDSSLVDQAIQDARATPRDQLLGMVENDTSLPAKKQFPLVMKFNPRLPPMSRFIHQHLHVLELTERTKSLFNKKSMFVSYKMEKNILSMTTCNKFKEEPSPSSGAPLISAPTQPDDPNWGCHHCQKSCTLCKNFLREARTFTSPKTSQTFKIRSHIDCNTKNVIYLILDLKCTDIFYIGYTTDCMAVRWRNHKSHIKKSIKSCELASHFVSLSSTTHKIDKSSQATFTSELKEHLAIILIESVIPKTGLDVETILKEREDFWQGALKSTPLFGGINKRSNKSRAKKS